MRLSFRQKSNKIRRSNSPISLRAGGRGGGGRGGGGSKGGGSGGKSGGGSSGGGKTSSTGGFTSRGSSGFGISGSSRKATPFSSGGGKYQRIPDSAPFGGRNLGGGTRGQVYGNSRYGSGYPPGPYSSGGSFVGGRGFPFGFWPLFIGGGAVGYYGNREYGPENNSSHPGGGMSTVTIRSTAWPNVTTPTNGTAANSTSSPLAFHILGDRESVQDVLDVLVTSSCDVVNSTIVSYSASNKSQPQPENIVQYYRGSSFALALDGYNNTAALLSNEPTNNDTAFSGPGPSPLPTNGTDTTFLNCINGTIGESVPIVDAGFSLRLGSQLNLQYGMMGLMWLIVITLRSLF